MKHLLIAAIVCSTCIDWTRLAGTVKAINLKDSTVTIQNRDGDLLTVPVDYQIKITEKHGELRSLQNLQLDEKVTLIRIQAPKVEEDEFNKTKG